MATGTFYGALVETLAYREEWEEGHAEEHQQPDRPPNDWNSKQHNAEPHDEGDGDETLDEALHDTYQRPCATGLGKLCSLRFQKGRHGSLLNPGSIGSRCDNG